MSSSTSTAVLTILGCSLMESLSSPSTNRVLGLPCHPAPVPAFSLFTVEAEMLLLPRTHFFSSPRSRPPHFSRTLFLQLSPLLDPQFFLITLPSYFPISKKILGGISFLKKHSPRAHAPCLPALHFCAFCYCGNSYRLSTVCVHFSPLLPFHLAKFCLSMSRNCKDHRGPPC